MTMSVEDQRRKESWLYDDVIDMILAFLSIADIPKAALVCKQWRHLITSSSILRSVWCSIHKSKPWLFVLGANKRRGLGLDPVSSRWIHLPARKFYTAEEYDERVMEGNGFLFSLSGSRLKFTNSFLNPRKWQEAAAPMRVWRQHPLICYDSESNKIFVIGGVYEVEENPLCVEMFDMNKKGAAWEICDSLPQQFKQRASSTWLTSVVCNGKIYVMEIHKGDCCCYDLQSRQWGRVLSVRPSPSLASACGEWVKYYPLACRGGLFLAALVRKEEEKMSLSIWKLEESTMECEVDREIRMPSEMLNILITGRETAGEEEELEYSSLECRGGGDIVYVFSKSRYESGRRVCLFDFSTDVWEMLEDDDDGGGSSVNWRERVLFVCSPVTLDETSLV